MPIYTNPQNLPLGLGAFQVDPNLDAGITKSIFNAVTGLVTQARVLTPKSATKQERSTVELEYLWNPNSSNARQYRLNFHDIEVSDLLALGIERFDVSGETRKTVQQTMGRLNRGQMITGDSTQWRSVTVTLNSWVPIPGGGTQTFQNPDSTYSTYYVFIASLPDSALTTPIYIEQSFSNTYAPGQQGTQPSKLVSINDSTDVLPTYGNVGAGKNSEGWWWYSPGTAGVPQTTSNLVLYVDVTYSPSWFQPTPLLSYKDYLIATYKSYTYFTNQLESLDTNKVVDYEDTIYVDTWATAPDKIVIAGVCELPQGYETTGICLKFDGTGHPLSLQNMNKDTFPTQFFKALEEMYYLNNHPQAIRRGDCMFLNDFSRGQRIPVTFKSRRYPVSVDKPFLAPFELEFIALIPLAQAKEITGSGS